jgi:hypothetical protein
MVDVDRLYETAFVDAAASAMTCPSTTAIHFLRGAILAVLARRLWMAAHILAVRLEDEWSMGIGMRVVVCRRPHGESPLAINADVGMLDLFPLFSLSRSSSSSSISMHPGIGNGVVTSKKGWSLVVICEWSLAAMMRVTNPNLTPRPKLPDPGSSPRTNGFDLC